MSVRWLVLFAVCISAQAADDALQPYQPPTPQDRARWFVRSAIGPGSIASSVVSAGLSTLQNTPEEYGPHWDGFGRRLGLEAADRTLGSGLELGIGGIWHEDPRYFRVPERGTTGRIRNIVKMTFVTHNRNGEEMPAYARFISIPASAFIVNNWHPPSERSADDALYRIGSSFMSRLLNNAFQEFWPDVKQKVFRINRPQPYDQNAPLGVPR